MYIKNILGFLTWWGWGVLDLNANYFKFVVLIKKNCYKNKWVVAMPMSSVSSLSKTLKCHVHFLHSFVCLCIHLVLQWKFVLLFFPPTMLLSAMYDRKHREEVNVNVMLHYYNKSITNYRVYAGMLKVYAYYICIFS